MTAMLLLWPPCSAVLRLCIASREVSLTARKVDSGFSFGPSWNSARTTTVPVLTLPPLGRITRQWRGRAGSTALQVLRLMAEVAQAPVRAMRAGMMLLQRWTRRQ